MVEREKGPKIVALEHQTKLLLEVPDDIIKEFIEGEFVEADKKIIDLLTGLSQDGKKRILFIELKPEMADKVMQLPPEQWPKIKHSIPKPFFSAVSLAHKLGWQIVPLDIDDSQRAHEIFVRGWLEEGFLNKNLRESTWTYTSGQRKPWPGWIWAEQIRPLDRAPTEDDVMIMHPNHVERWENVSNMEPEVVWLNKPHPDILFERLSPEEVVKFMQEKQPKRKKQKA